MKNTTLPNLLDLIAPLNCRGCKCLGQPLCNCCKNYIINNGLNFCPNCKRPKKSGKCLYCKKLPPTYFIDERKGLLDQIIHDYKYHSIRALAPILARLLNSKLPKLPSDTIFVPLPTATNHIRSRGFDHTKIIVKHLAKLNRCQKKSIFIRVNNTVQVGSNLKTRLVQAEHAFTINPKYKINPTTTYVLFDDVWTTGASIKTAVKKLQQAGAKKIIIALLAVSRLD